MRIIVDAFGGDHAPDEIIKGAVKAADELSVEVVLCGDESKIKESAQKNNVSLEKIEIMQASEFSCSVTKDLRAISLKQALSL